MSTNQHLVLISENTLVVNGDLRPYQVVELRDSQDHVTARYSRYLGDDGSSWVRHGVWQSFAPNGKLTSQGTYEHGLEHGRWEDYFENGQIAARGDYQRGREAPGWSFWSDDGTPQPAPAN